MSTSDEVSTKSRAEELQALAEAKKIIMETTGGASDKAYGLLQQASKARSTSDPADKVVNMLQTLGKSNKDVALAQLALRVKAAVEMQTGADPFAKVKGMIQEMIDKLVADAAAEASHKAFCDKEMSESKAKIEDHTSTIEKFTTRKDKATAAIEKLTEELATLADELATMAKQQAEMDEMRAEQKAAYAEAKKEFEKITQENQVTKAIKEADIKYKTSEVASLEKQVSELTSDIEGEQTELDAVLDYYEKLKPGCIAKPMTYEERKARREAEIAGLKEALAILEGESFLQTTSF